MKPVVSVIIPAYNAAATLGGLLQAVKTQAGLPGGYEVIVVDNGSTDDTVQVAQSFGVTVLHQAVRGPSAARNLGLSAAQGEIVVCTDADTIPTRHWLASLYSAFAKPEVLQATGPIHGWQPATAAERFACQRQVFDGQKTAAHPVQPFAIGMNHAVRRQAALAIRGWDEAMTSGEDTDFGLRMHIRFASPIVYVPRAILFHRHRSTDEALWRQARWHGAGYAMLRQKHPDRLPWRWWHALFARASVRVLQGTTPLVALCHRLKLISAARVEFEFYHRHWTREFWAGYFEQWRKPFTGRAQSASATVPANGSAPGI